MSTEINLREIFMKKIKTKLYSELMGGPLKDWDYKFVLQVADQTMKEKQGEIESYIRNQNVTLLNMDLHVEVIVEKILLAHLGSKRVE